MLAHLRLTSCICIVRHTLRGKNLKLKVEPYHEPMTANSYTALSAEGAETS